MLAEENKALGGKGLGMEFSGTASGSFIQMKVPEYFCTVICAGLDIEELVKDANLSRTVKKDAESAKSDTLESSNFEESKTINVVRYNNDSNVISNN